MDGPPVSRRFLPRSLSNATSGSIELALSLAIQTNSSHREDAFDRPTLLWDRPPLHSAEQP